MKILSMSEQRMQDRMDVHRLVQFAIDLDVPRILDNLALIVKRGYHRDQDLLSKFESVMKMIDLPTV